MGIVMNASRTAKVVRLHRLGGPEVLELEDLRVEDPKAGEVRLRVQAIGLNRAEILFREGNYLEQPEFPSRIGVEAAGIVDAVGPDVTQIRIGDRVSVAPGQSIGCYGTYGESAIVPAASALPYPANLTPIEAASIWVQYLTAYFALVDVGGLKPGHSVLLTAATGGAGFGAIQVARLLGATVIATTRSAAKRQPLLDAGAHYVIMTGEESLVTRIKEITRDKGVDLIFDPVAGQSLPTIAEAVAWGGQIILYGALGGRATPYPLATGFARNFTLRTFLVYNYSGLPDFGIPRDEAAFARAVKFIQLNLAKGILKPLIAKTFPLNRIRQAHEYMQSNRQLGKIVVVV
jgi:NADPH2:quinone reductase